MGTHLIDGEFQSDKYPTTPRGKVPLSVRDKTAQDLLWQYAQRRRPVDAEFSDDLETALRDAGYEPHAAVTPPFSARETAEAIARSLPLIAAKHDALVEAIESALASRDAVIAKQASQLRLLVDGPKACEKIAESRIADLEAKLAERTRERDESDAALFHVEADGNCEPGTCPHEQEIEAAIERHRNKDASR